MCIVERRVAARGAPVPSCVPIFLADARVDSMRDVVDALDVPVRGTASGAGAVTGFSIHRRVLAAASRPDDRPVADVLTSSRRVAVLEDVSDHENVGVLFRNAAGLGVGTVLLSPRCCDRCTGEASGCP